MFKEFYIQKATLRRPQVSEWVSFAFNALTLLLNMIHQEDSWLEKNSVSVITKAFLLVITTKPRVNVEKWPGIKSQVYMFL